MEKLKQYKSGINEYLRLRGYTKNIYKHPILFDYSKFLFGEKLPINDIIMTIGKDFTTFSKWFNSNQVNLNQHLFNMKTKYFFLIKLRGRYTSLCVKNGMSKSEARGKFNKKKGKHTISEMYWELQSLFGNEFDKPKRKSKVILIEETPNFEEYWKW